MTIFPFFHGKISEQDTFVSKKIQQNKVNKRWGEKQTDLSFKEIIHH